VVVAIGVIALAAALPVLGPAAAAGAGGWVLVSLGTAAFGGTATIFGSTLAVEGITDKNALRDFLGQETFDDILILSTWVSGVGIETISNSGFSPGVSKGTGTAGADKKVLDGGTGKSGTTRVGRWMSQAEYDKMVKTGRVQMSPNGNTAYVANPAFKAAPSGSICVEI